MREGWDGAGQALRRAPGRPASAPGGSLSGTGGLFVLEVGRLSVRSLIRWGRRGMRPGRRQAWLVGVAAVALLGPVGPLEAKSAREVRDEATCAALGKEEGYKGRLDVVVFDHAAGELVWPQPAQLWVRDGDPFVVVVTNTHPYAFTYSSSVVASDAAAGGPGQVVGERVTVKEEDGVTVCVSFRFVEGFPLHKMEISGSAAWTAAAAAVLEKAATDTDDPMAAARFKVFRMNPREALKVFESGEAVGADAVVADAAKKGVLYPYTFPVWVRDSRAQLGFATGLAFSDVTSDRFFVETDDQGTAETTDDEQRVLAESSSDDFRPDLMAYASITAPRTPTWWGAGGRLGVTVGLGIGDGGDPRYFLGPSWLIGDRFLVAAGAFGGKVDRLPAGQREGEAPINGANTLSQLGKGFERGWAVGVAWRFGSSDKADEKFLAALSPPVKQEQKAKPAEGAAEKKPDEKSEEAEGTP